MTLAGGSLGLANAPAGTVTIDAGVLVAGDGTLSDEAAQTFAYGQWQYSTPGTVDNEGTIAADVRDRP